jgi:peptidoglycan/xylan/chitin deacetylase (PgdA/CDA1 family)
VDHSLSLKPSIFVDRCVTSALGRRSFLVLIYHGVRPDDARSPSVNWRGKHVSKSGFAEQIDWLIRTGYRFLDGDELHWVVQRRRLPRGPAAVITFDDGYANNHTAALPVLRDRSITAVVFLVGDFIARREPLWVDRLEQAFAGAKSEEVTADFDGTTQRFPLRNLPERQLAEASVRAKCKRLSPSDRQRVLGELLSRLAAPTSPLPSLYDPLSWAQVDELRQAGWEIGSHTMTHTILAGLETPVARREVEDAKTLVEEQLGISCDLFAYPNGLRGDFTPATQRLVSELGKVCAFAGIEGRVRRDFDPFAVRRISVHDRMGLGEFRLRTTGAVGVAKSVKAALRRVALERRAGRAGVDGSEAGA